MPITSNTPLLPPWIGLPIAAAVLLVIAAHVLILQSANIDPRRKRIRTANGLLMLFVTTLLAYALSIATPATPSLFVLAWLAVVGLLTIVITVALFDVLHTLKLHTTARRDLRREMATRLPKDSAPPNSRIGEPPKSHEPRDSPTDT